MRQVDSGRQLMRDNGTSGLVKIILVWIIGLAVGIGAGALTARLLMPLASAPDRAAPASGDPETETGEP